MSQRRSDDSGIEGQRFELGAVQSIAETHVGRVRSVNQDAQGDWCDPESASHLFFIAVRLSVLPWAAAWEAPVR